MKQRALGRVLRRIFRLSRLASGYPWLEERPFNKYTLVGGEFGIPVIEDNALNQKFALILLKRMGYAADIVVNSVEALEAYLNARMKDFISKPVRVDELAAVLEKVPTPVASRPHRPHHHCTLSVVRGIK